MTTKINSKPVISETIDSHINSLSLAFTFIVLGILLAIRTDYFGNPLAATIAQWIFIAIGIVGFLSSFGDTNSKIVGTTDIGVGILLMALGVALYLFLPKPIGGIFSLTIFLFSIYGIIRGVLFVIVSTWNLLSAAQQNKNDTNKKISAIIEGLTKLSALALVILQIAKLYAG